MPSPNTTPPTYSKCLPKACYSRKSYSHAPGDYNKQCCRPLGYKAECGCGCGTAAAETVAPATEKSEADSGDDDLEEMSSLEWVIQLFSHN